MKVYIATKAFSTVEVLGVYATQESAIEACQDAAGESLTFTSHDKGRVLIAEDWLETFTVSRFEVQP